MTMIARWRTIALVSGTAAALAGASPAGAVIADAPSYVPPLASCQHFPAMHPFLALGDPEPYVLAPGGDFAAPAAGTWSWPTERASSRRGRPTAPPATSSTCRPRTGDERPDVRHLRLPDSPHVDPQRQRLCRCVVERFLLPPGQAGMEEAEGRRQWDGRGQPVVPSDSIGIKPSRDRGWQQVRFTLVGNGASGARVQVDDLWIDPRASR